MEDKKTSNEDKWVASMLVRMSVDELCVDSVFWKYHSE